MAKNDEEHSFVLDHFAEDAEEEIHECNYCGKKYGLCVSCKESGVVDPSSRILGTHLTNCEVLSRREFLFEKIKPMIWAIKVHTSKCAFSATGFSVSNDGLIMTAAHAFEECMGAEEILVHTMDNKFKGTAQIVKYRPEADLALLKVSDIDSCESVVFLSDVFLTVGEELITIGVRTSLMGYVSFGCTEIEEIRRDKNCQAKTYNPEEQSLRKYQVLGDIYNVEHLKSNNPDKFSESLNPFVPIIRGQLNTIGGNSGSPVFNIKGEVVGIVHGHVGADFIAIHVSELVNFLDEYINKQDAPPSEYATKDIQKK